MKEQERFKPLPADSAALLGEGKIIEAVKVLRASRDISLLEAKNWVDWHIEQDPALRARLDAQQRDSRRKLFVWFLCVDAVIVAGVICYFYLRGGH
jgi:hypothetical protein